MRARGSGWTALASHSNATIPVEPPVDFLGRKTVTSRLHGVSVVVERNAAAMTLVALAPPLIVHRQHLCVNIVDVLLALTAHLDVFHLHLGPLSNQVERKTRFPDVSRVIGRRQIQISALQKKRETRALIIHLTRAAARVQQQLPWVATNFELRRVHSISILDLERREIVGNFPHEFPGQIVRGRQTKRQRGGVDGVPNSHFCVR